MANPKRWPIGLQTSTTGRPQGIGEVIQELTRNNIAFFSAATDSFSILTDLQNAREQNPHVPHTGNFTPTGYIDLGGGEQYHLSVPEYGKPHSEEIARKHWDMVELRVPIKRDGETDSPIDWDIPCIWVSTWNEVRAYVGWYKNGDTKEEPEQPVIGYEGNADLIGWQAYEIGREAVKRGYRWAAFGFSGGNPEEGFWEAPGVLAYLKLCHENPEQLGIALHEYSLTDTILNRPDHIGRFKQLHESCDRHNLRRPVIQIKEFGWRDIKIPNSKKVAMQELIEVAGMYMEHPNIHGAAIWTVQKWQNSGIRDKVVALIPHLREAALEHARTIGELKTPAKPPDIQPNQPGPKRPITSPVKIIPVRDIGFVTAPAGLNLRSEPNTAGQEETIIDLLPLGTRVDILNRLDGWYQVKAGNKTGYVSADYISVGDPAPQPVLGTPPATANSSFQPGMNINIGVHEADVDRLRGLSWVRFVLIAADEGRSIDEAFSERYRTLIEQYAAAGIKSLIILNHQTEHGPAASAGHAPWTMPGGGREEDWSAYAEHFGRAARRAAELCAPFGDDVAFQIWNEQDSGWSSDKGNPNPSARGLLPGHFALILGAASRSIREAAPQATIVAGGLKTGPANGRDYLKKTSEHLDSRLPVDAIAYHPYGRYVHTDPFYSRQFGTLPDALAIFKRSFPALPLWITEIGVPGHQNVIGPEYYANIALYMSEFVTEIANNHADQVPVLIWFAWTDRMENAGVLTAEGHEKDNIFPAFLAMKARGCAKGSSAGALESLFEATFETVLENGFVTAPAGLNLRSEPSTARGTESIIGVLLQGTEVDILERLAGWYRIRSGVQEGYVSADYISTVVPHKPHPVSGPARPGTGSGDSVTGIRKQSDIIGVHGAPGGAAPPKHLWDQWTDYLKEMGVRWYKQCETTDSTGDGSIFEWVLHLKRNGIEPIVRYLASEQFPDNLEQRTINQMRRYADAGVHWAEIGNEPNLAYEWKSTWRGRYEGEWPNGKWVEEPRMRWSNPEAINTLARVWVEDAQRAADAGAWPAFYAFGPTDWGNGRPHGYYSSTMFTDLVVARLASHHRQETIRLFHDKNAWIAVHVAKYEKDFNFDPYSENPNKPWDMSLRGYEVVLNAFRRHFGGDLDIDSIPIISTEGGVFTPEHSNRVDRNRLPADDHEHARQTVEMYRYIAQETPLTAMCPWCIAEGHNIIGHGTDEFRDHGWFKELHGRIQERPVYQYMRRLAQETGAPADTILESIEIPTAKPKSKVTIQIQIEIKVGGAADNISLNIIPGGD